VTASAAWFVPDNIVTEANPVSAGVGYVPTSPVIVVVPEFVIPAAARTAKLVAVPSLGWVAASAVAGQIRSMRAARLSDMIDLRILITSGTLLRMA
jgi:hypothetical protein